MSKSPTRAFVIGRAAADLIRERTEATMTDVMGQFGKLLTEWIANWQTFADDVMVRADQEESRSTGIPDSQGRVSNDLQATLDDLRAEVAQLRSELQKYRSRSV